MNRTWKCLLGLVAIGASWSHAALAQNPESEGVVSLGGTSAVTEAAPPTAGDPGTEGAIRLGTPPAEPPVNAPQGVQKTQFEEYQPPPGVFLDPNVPVDPGVGYAVTQDPASVLYRVGRINRNYIGIEEGYTNLNAFIPVRYADNQSILAVNPRLNITDQGRAAANLGLTHRIYDPVLDRVFSVSGWYDYDDGHAGEYHQLGMHFASIGQFFSLRGGFTLPIGDMHTTFGTMNLGMGRIEGSNILVDVAQSVETAYQQYEIEASTPVPLLGRYGFDFGLGFYYLNSHGFEDSPGISTRVEAQITEDFWLNTRITSDKVYGSNLSVNFELTLPDGPPAQFFRPNPVRQAMFASDRRNYRVATEITQIVRTIVVSDGGGGGGGGGGGRTNLTIATIDPNKLTPGDGTFENPFMSVEEYMALTATERDRFSVVYVLGRDDLTDANLNTTITLLDSQRLLGAGIDQTIRTSLGPITLPAASSGVAPLLTNSAAPNLDVITLADNNEVSGFTIDASGSANAISGTNINSFNIHNNTIQNFIEGVAVTHVGTGRAEFYDNVVTGNGFRSNRGLSIDHTTGTLDLLVQNNTFDEIRGEDANGDGLITPSEDANMNGILDGGEDVNGNGILDLGEDINTNGALDRGIAVHIVANGSTINASDLSGMRDVGIFDNTFTSTGTGLELIAQGGATANLDIQDNTAQDSTDEMGAGFNLLADGSTINVHSFLGNTASGGQGDGLRIVTDNNGTIIVADPLNMASAFNGNDLSGNAGDGAFVLADSGTITFDYIGDRLDDDPLGNMFNNNGDDGLELQTMAGGTITVINPLLGNQFNNNGDNGLVTTALTGTINVETSLTTLSNSFTGNGATTGLGAGISYVVGPGGVINTGVFDLTISGNAGNGIAFILDGGTINLTGFDRNTFTNNGLNGVLISNSNGGTFITPTVANNDFSNNGEAGMFITGDGGAGGSTINLGNVVANNFNRDVRGTEGILFDTVDVTTTLNVLRNSFVGRNTAGDLSGRGIGGIIHGGGLNMFVGNFSTADANMFQNNADAHIGLTLRGDSINRIEIDNSLFEGAVDDASTTGFFGGGVALRLRDTAKLTGFVRRSMFLNNDDDGLRMDIAGNNPAGNRGTDTAQLNDFVIGGAAPGDGNVFQGNGDDGLSIVRTERGQFNNLTIENNLFDSNANRGLFITSQGVNQANLPNMMPDSVTIDNNTIIDNGTHGVEFQLGADADLLADMDLNLIDGNAVNGIFVSELVNDAEDSRTITGTWTRNEITNNGNDGIALNGRFGNPLNDAVPGAGLIIGDPTVNAIGDLSGMGNLISLNGGDGVQVISGGVVTIGNNVITRNGTVNGAGQLVNAGINIDGPEFPRDNSVQIAGEFPTPIDDDFRVGNAYQEVNIVSNHISQNVGDGIEWLNESGVDDFDSQDTVGGPDFAISSLLTVINNNITENEGRGIDLLNRPGDSDNTDTDNVDPESSVNNNVVGSITGDVTIIGNHVKGNLLEGIYVVNTNATDQSQVVPSSDTLSESGGIAPRTSLRLDIHNNEIIGNGANVTNFPATGLVVRVGTTDGGFSFAFDGGFATTGFNIEDLDGDGILDNDINGDGVLNAAATLFGGISASVTGNTLDGNFGDDILFHSFRSTVDPPTTGGTWNDMEFTPMGYRSDPLARMDLIFSNNNFSSIEANNRDRSIVTGNEPGAFYNNAEGNFKSRTFDPMDPSSGPFNSATRRRNAQRLASRYLTNPGGELEPFPPVPPSSISFLYPGMGDSTFRVRGQGNEYTDRGLGMVLISDIFILDDPTLVGDPTVVDATFEANGVFFSGANLFGELPFGWGTY